MNEINQNQDQQQAQVQQKQRYIGVEIILGYPTLSQGVINTADGTPGMEIERQDGTKVWVPTVMFNNTFRPLAGVPFGMVVEGTRMDMVATNPSWTPGEFIKGVFQDPQNQTGFHICKSVNGQLTPWVPSPEDMFRVDWVVQKSGQ